MLLLGQNATGGQVPVFVGDDGRIYTWLVGQDGSGNPQIVKVDSDGQLYTILRGAGNIDVAVDSDGFLTVVLKGIQAGALTTISVDGDGRIEAFGLDAENQWGDTLKTGNSELAARLGSPMAWDWRGNALCLCTFENGIPFGSGTGYGTGSSVTVSPDYFVRGGYAAKLVAGSDGNHAADVGGAVGPNPSELIGFEICFSVSGSPTDLYLNITAQTGVNAWRGRVQLDMANDDLEYLNSGGSWVKVDDLAILELATAFHSFKFVVDGSTGEYVRVMVDETEFDISGISMVDLGASFTPQIGFSVFLTGRSGENDIAYIDSYILTINEPL